MIKKLCVMLGSIILGGLMIYANNEYIFTRGELDVRISSIYDNDKISLEINIINKNNKPCYIQKAYLNFFIFDKRMNRLTMINNWLIIMDDQRKEALYKGRYTNIISSNSYEDDPFDFIFLDKNTTYKILVNNVEDYYFWGNSKFIDISYLGPLGESNVLRVYLNHGRIKSLADEKNL